MGQKQILQEEKRLRLALSLAEAPNIGTLKPSTCRRLWREYHRFVGLPLRSLGDWGIEGLDPQTGRAAHLGFLSQIQQLVRELLVQKVNQETISVSMKGDVQVKDGKIEFVEFSGDPLDTFRMNLAFLLGSEVARRLRQCPECKRVFLRVRRQIYCQDQCTDKATWRNYPDKKKRQARERQYKKHGWTVGARKQKQERKKGSTK